MKHLKWLFPIILMALVAVWSGSTWAGLAKQQSKVRSFGKVVSSAPGTDVARMQKAKLHSQKLDRTSARMSEEKEYTTLRKKMDNGEQLSPGEKTRLEQLTARHEVRRSEGRPLDDQGGPDAFGYLFMDNQNGDTTGFSWIELCGDGQATDGPSGDDISMSISLGLTFPFYGASYTSAWIETNGAISFDHSFTEYDFQNYCVDNPLITAGKYIFPYWDDLYCVAPGGGCDNAGTGPWIRYRNFGDYTVIEWSNVPHFFGTADRFSFEAILYSNGRVKLQYNTDWNDSVTPNSALIGLEDSPTAGNGLQYRCMTDGPGSQITGGRAIWFFQPNGIPNAVTNLQGSANGTTVTLTWTDPTQDINGNPIVVDSIQVWQGEPNIGTELGVVGPGVQTFTQVNAPQGNNMYSVRPYNDGFEGAYVSVNVIVGTPSYVQDFETSDGGWVPEPSTGGWEWGAPTAPDGPQAHGGTNVWGTVLGGDYALDACYTLTLNLGTPIQSPTATVEFWRWYDIEQNFDGCNFQVSTDQGATWTIVEPVGSYGDTTYDWNQCLTLQPAWTGNNGNSWAYVVLPIGQFVGQVPQFRFVFSSDGSITYPGFYFDDMTIWGLGTVSDGPPLPVTNLAAEANGNNVTLTWTDPDHDVVGNPIVVDSLQIWLGPPETGTHLGTVAHGVQTFTQVNAPNGSNTYYVRPYNNGFIGASAFVSIIAGSPAYGQDFESDNGGWVPTPETGGWEWGAPTAPDGPQAHSGSNVWGTVLAGDYPDNACFTLDLNLGLTVQSATAYVEFWMWYDIESFFDGCDFRVSTDGGTTWELVTPDGGYPETEASNDCIGINGCWAGTTNGWVHTTIPIGQYVGQAPIFRFVFGSDISVTYAGFYFDDMLIWGMQPPYPVGTLAGQTRILSNNQALANTRVIAVSPDMTDSTVSDGQGFYVMDLRTGTYSVTFRHADYCDSVRTGVVIDSAQTVTLNASLRAPLAAASVSSITHQGAAGQQTSTTFNLTDDGNCSLIFAITDDQPWLDALPATGTIAAGGTQEITVWFNGSGMTPGEYDGTLTITHNAAGSPLVIPVQYIIPTAAGNAGESLPTVFALHGNYPNPFNAVTEIRYDLPQNAHVSLVLYNMLGQEVRELVNATMPAGRQTAVWDGKNALGGDMTSGIYLVRLVAGEHTFTDKIMLLK